MCVRRFEMRVENIGVARAPRPVVQKQTPSFRRNWAEHASWGANYVKQKGKTNCKSA